MIQFLIRVLQLSPGEAASRVRAAAAVGTAYHHAGREAWNRCCRGWPRCNATVWCSAEKVQIVERAMHQLLPARPRPARSDQTAEQLLTEHAAVLGYHPTCAASPSAWSMPPTRTGPSRSMINCSRTGGMWS